MKTIICPDCFKLLSPIEALTIGLLGRSTAICDLCNVPYVRDQGHVIGGDRDEPFRQRQQRFSEQRLKELEDYAGE
jgi:hypothetical protein